MAALLRIGLAGNQPLWNDEVFSLAMVTGHSLEHSATIPNRAAGDFVEPVHPVSAEELCRYLKHDDPPAGFSGIFHAQSLSDTHPPLYYLLLYGWTRVLGTSDAVLRGFSIVCSLACFPFLAGIARQIAGRKAILPSCLLFAFSPLGICFSTEGRMYSLLWLCLVAVVWVSLHWRQDGRTRFGVAWIATSSAGLLTHYFFVFPWAALLIFLLLRPGKISRTRLITALALTAAIILPWYMRIPETLGARRVTQHWLRFEPDGFNRPIAALKLVLQNFTGTGHHKSSNFVALVIFAIIGLTAVLRLRLRVFRTRPLVLWLLFAAPCVGLQAFDLFTHSYAAAHERYAIAALPFACLLAAAGLVSLARPTRILLLVLILLTWAPNLLIHEQTGKRLSARNRAQIVSARAAAGDLILIDATPSGLLNIARYLKGPAPVAGWMPSWIQEPTARQTPDMIPSMIVGRSRVWWIGGAGAPPIPPEKDWLVANAEVFYNFNNVVIGLQPKEGGTF